MYQEIGILNYSSGKELWPNFLWGQEMANRGSDNVIQNSPVPLNNPIVTKQYWNLTLRTPSVLWLVPDLPLQGKEIQSLHMCREPGKNRCSNLWIYNKKQKFTHTHKKEITKTKRSLKEV